MYLQLMVLQQGHPTAECFSLFGKFTGALNTIHLFECLRGTLFFSKVLGGLFVSSETVSYPDESGRKFKDVE